MRTKLEDPQKCSAAKCVIFIFIFFTFSGGKEGSGLKRVQFALKRLRGFSLVHLAAVVRPLCTDSRKLYCIFSA